MICSLCHKKIVVETDDFEETASCEFGHTECVDKLLAGKSQRDEEEPEEGRFIDK